MNDQLAEDPQTILDRIQQQATRYETPVRRRQNGLAPVGSVRRHRTRGRPVSRRRRVVAALDPHHPGAGSAYRVLVPDLPGLGESDFPPDGDDAFAIATIVADGIDIIVGAATTYEVVGFSFGGTMAACVGALARQACPLGHDHRLVRRRCPGFRGEAGKSPPSGGAGAARHPSHQPQPPDDRRPGKIDDLAILIQDWNTVRSRLRTPAISRSGAIMKAIDQLQSPLNGMWGELDAPANPKGSGAGGDIARALPAGRHPPDPEDRPLGRLRIRRYRQRDTAGNAGAHASLIERLREETRSMTELIHRSPAR